MSLSLGQIWHMLKHQQPQGWIVILVVTALVQLAFWAIESTASNVFIRVLNIDMRYKFWRDGSRWTFIIMWLVQHVNSSIARAAILRALAVMFAGGGGKASIRDCFRFVFLTWRAVQVFGAELLVSLPLLIWTLIPYEIMYTTWRDNAFDFPPRSSAFKDSIVLFVGFGFIFGLVFLVGILYVLSGLYLYAPVIVVENNNSSVLQALVRSWKLTFGYRWKILMLALVLNLSMTLISWYLCTADHTSVKAPFHPRTLTVTCLLSIVTTPMIATIQSMIYFYLRSQYENWNDKELDGELLTAAAASSSSASLQNPSWLTMVFGAISSSREGESLTSNVPVDIDGNTMQVLDPESVQEQHVEMD